MELAEFLLQTRADVKQEIADRMSVPGREYPYEETVFTEIVMNHMASIGMAFEPEPCHYERTIGNAKLRLGGYAVSEDADQLDLFVSLYAGVETVTPIPDRETKTGAEQCLRFLKRCAEGRLASTMDQSDDAYRVAHTIHESYSSLDQIRIYVLTDRQAKAKNFRAREVQGRTVKLEVMDIERLWRHWSEGKPRDELVVNFQEVSGSALPCVYVQGEMADYDYALTAIPGEALRFMYQKYDARLLEANVRSFLSATGKVNRGIRDTLRASPERFMAYNNGIVLVVDEMHLARTADGSPRYRMAEGNADRERGSDNGIPLFLKEEITRNRSRSGPHPRQDHSTAHGRSGRGGRPDLRYLQVRQQPELREAVRLFGEQTLPHRRGTPFANRLLSGRCRTLVL